MFTRSVPLTRRKRFTVEQHWWGYSVSRCTVMGEAIRCPVDEAIQCLVDEAIRCPVDVAIRCPVDAAIWCPVDEAIWCLFGKTIRCPVEWSWLFGVQWSCCDSSLDCAWSIFSSVYVFSRCWYTCIYWLEDGYSCVCGVVQVFISSWGVEHIKSSMTHPLSGRVNCSTKSRSLPEKTRM